MANFTPLDSLGTKNGMSELTVQTTEQRAQIEERDPRGSTLKFGVASASSIFVDNGADIKSNSFNAMLDMYEGGTVNERYQGTGATLNPDFVGDLELGYDETPNINSDLNDVLDQLKDKPSYFGPNLKSHSIDETGEPEFNPTLARNSTSDTKLITADGNPRRRGFGNEEGHTRTIGSYMRRRWSASQVDAAQVSQHPQLGEYRDHANLKYSNVSVRDENS